MSGEANQNRMQRCTSTGLQNRGKVQFLFSSAHKRKMLVSNYITQQQRIAISHEGMNQCGISKTKSNEPENTSFGGRDR